MKKTDNRGRTVEMLKRRFVFGTQYFRPPTPLPDEWESDLDHIQSLGMDHIRLWALWCAIEPRQGAFRFDAYDRLLDLAGDRNLGVIVNIILDSVPIWAVRRNDGWLRTAQGLRDPRILLNGGHFACWDNPAMRADAETFIHALAERYRGLPQLILWDVWNEVKYYECWCPHSSKAFADYLLEKHGSLDALNAACGTSFGDPGEIELPPSPVEISLSLEAGRFVRRRLDEQIAWVRDTVRAVDDVTPTMTHSHSGGTVNSGSPMWDDWTVCKTCDIWGGSQHITYYQNQHDSQARFSYTVANLESKRASGHYWLAEVSTGIIRGGTVGMQNRVNEGELTFNLWTFFAHGARGMTFWQFHPERYSAEAPGWGLVAMDGSPTFHTEEAKRFKAVLERHRDFFETAAPPKSRYGIFYDPVSSSLQDMMRRSDYTRNFHGIVCACWANSVQFDILRETDDFTAYDKIYFPAAFVLSDAALEKILSYIEGGGKAFVDAGFGSYYPNGFYRTHVPGDALWKRFGYRETDIIPLRGKFQSGSDGSLGHVPIEADGRVIEGAYNYRRVVPGEGAQVAGRLPDGFPGVLRSRIGKGELIYIASFPGPALLEADERDKAREFIGFLGMESQVAFTSAANVTARVMERPGEQWVILFNHDRGPAEVRFSGEETFEPVFESTPTFPALRFGPKGVKVLRRI